MRRTWTALLVVLLTNSVAIAQSGTTPSLEELEKQLQQEKKARADKSRRAAAAEQEAQRRSEESALIARFDHIRGNWANTRTYEYEWMKRGGIYYCEGKLTWSATYQIASINPQTGVASGKIWQKLKYRITQDLSDRDNCERQFGAPHNDYKYEGSSESVFTARLVKTEPYEQWNLNIQTLKCAGICGDGWYAGSTNQLALRFYNGEVAEIDTNGADPAPMRRL